MSDATEKELLLDYINKRSHYEDMKSLSGDAYRALEAATQKLVEHLEDSGKDATAQYSGLGKVSLAKPTLSAKFDEDDRNKVFDFLRQEGLDDVIKENVHHSTLSSIIASRVKDGLPVPEFFKTSFRKNIRFKSE